LRLLEGGSAEAHGGIRQHQEPCTFPDARVESGRRTSWGAIDLRRRLRLEEEPLVFDVNLKANSISAEEAAAVGAGEDPCGVTVIGWREEPQRAARERPRGDADCRAGRPGRAAAGRNVRTSIVASATAPLTAAHRILAFGRLDQK
jgi:hypothetical protein